MFRPRHVYTQIQNQWIVYCKFIIWFSISTFKRYICFAALHVMLHPIDIAKTNDRCFAFHPFLSQLWLEADLLGAFFPISHGWGIFRKNLRCQRTLWFYQHDFWILSIPGMFSSMIQCLFFLCFHGIGVKNRASASGDTAAQKERDFFSAFSRGFFVWFTLGQFVTPFIIPQNPFPPKKNLVTLWNLNYQCWGHDVLPLRGRGVNVVPWVLVLYIQHRHDHLCTFSRDKMEIHGIAIKMYVYI